MAKEILMMCVLVLSYAMVTADSCDIFKQFQKLKAKEITRAEYTKYYTDCIYAAEEQAKAGILPNSHSENGFQPSCVKDSPVTQAVAKINTAGSFRAADGKDYPFHIKGVITFTQLGNGNTMIKAVVSGTHSFLFDSDQFFLHVHKRGEINPTCTFTGGHYNPCGKEHSNDPAVENRHVGDVAKVTIPSDFTDGSILTFEMTDTQVKLSGPMSVLGRSVTIHGGSGATRVGCGTIAVTEWEGADHPDSIYDPTNSFWQ